ncbi:ribokinase [Mycolicibacterium madagascariense]|uniref:Ribokinase n=1 Tax=Mycolicibacterium madagascariense TaxID=212765 RepID=A0A7I7XG04_9MYCO|nr:ribokinase [Mycolicibacterium madagascariense]MCV7013841.1 ribokinase [Mycolicibacterium madagascariense]BBZ28122.1 ribokinase [Mycolicibacterium madagascariense]
MPEAPSVVVVGSINVDHVVTAPRFPRPGETIMGTSVSSSVGGKGANQAVAAALAGATVAMVAGTGDDADGARARERLVQRGVSTDDVAVLDAHVTGTAWITVAEQDNTIVVIAGANHHWAADTLPASIGTAAVMLAQLEIPVEVVHAAADRTTGLFVLNAAPAAMLPGPLLARCDVLVVNEHELAVVAGLDGVTDEDGISAAHDALRGRGVGAVVTTRGARGAIVTAADGVTTTLPAPRTDVVDTTGAGDAFTGVLAARLAAGDPLVEAARRGVIAGSLAVQAVGAQDSYPDFASCPTEAHP